MENNKAPVFEERLGNVRISVWENVDRNGNTFHKVSVVRRYKSANDEWTNTNSYTGIGETM